MMKINEEAWGILEKCALFAGLNEEQIRSETEGLSPRIRAYEKGALLFQAGDRIGEIGVVLSGSVHIMKEDLDGNETILAGIGKGGLFGESFACSQTPMTVFVRAGENCRILFLSAAGVMRGGSALALNLTRTFAKKNIFLTERIEHLSKRTLREKVMSYLTEQSVLHGSHSFEIPFDRQQLADYLAADRSALSAVLGKMKREGIITFHKNKFTLL